MSGNQRSIDWQLEQIRQRIGGGVTIGGITMSHGALSGVTPWQHFHIASESGTWGGGGASYTMGHSYLVVFLAALDGRVLAPTYDYITSGATLTLRDNGTADWADANAASRIIISGAY